MISKCPKCNSIWVEWNHALADAYDYGHACSDCNFVCKTDKWVHFGLPLLFLLWQEFLDPKYKRKQMLKKLDQ